MPPAHATRAVSHDLSGSIRDRCCRLVASCCRSWGSRDFGFFASDDLSCATAINCRHSRSRDHQPPSRARPFRAFPLHTAFRHAALTRQLSRRSRHPSPHRSPCAHHARPDAFTGWLSLSPFAGCLPRGWGLFRLSARSPTSLPTTPCDLRAFRHLQIRCRPPTFPLASRPMLSWALVARLKGRTRSRPAPSMKKSTIGVLRCH